MPTRCIHLFLAVYTEAILEVAQGLEVAHSQSNTSEGWGASCNRQNIAHQLLMLFLWGVRTTDVAGCDCGDDCRF